MVIQESLLEKSKASYSSFFSFFFSCKSSDYIHSFTLLSLLLYAMRRFLVVIIKFSSLSLHTLTWHYRKKGNDWYFVCIFIKWRQKSIKNDAIQRRKNTKIPIWPNLLSKLTSDNVRQIYLLSQCGCFVRYRIYCNYIYKRRRRRGSKKKRSETWRFTLKHLLLWLCKVYFNFRVI